MRGQVVEGGFVGLDKKISAESNKEGREEENHPPLVPFLRNFKGGKSRNSNMP